MDIKLYIQKHQLDVFGIFESDLHGPNSRYRRAKPLTESKLREILHIEGYRIILPNSWLMYDQARIIVYVREELQIKERRLSQENSDLQSISFEVGVGREKKTCLNFFYREFTGGISGLDDHNSQRDRLKRQVGH